MHETIQIAVCYLFFILIISNVRQKFLMATFSVIASSFVILEVLSIFITDRFIDYRFYNHLNLNSIEGHGFQFTAHILLFLIFFILSSILFYFSSRKIQQFGIWKNKYYGLFALPAFVFLSWPGGMFNELYNIIEITQVEEKNFEKALADVGIHPDEYITPDKVIAKKGKNIVVISIESLEQGFLGGEFNYITPNLTKLSNDWTFFKKMPPSPGGDWTAGSLYSHQVGVPAFFKGQGNDIFQGSTNAKLTGIGHILNAAGYDARYLLGNKEFGGIADILAAYKIQSISEINSLGKYNTSPMGLNDLDLFNEAKLQLDTIIGDKPFALFLSTINTHFPHGIYDKNMEKYIPRNKNSLEFSISAVDYLVKDFIEYLKQNKLYENTAIFIFPDHLLMGGSGPVIDKLKNVKRQLYLLTNVSEDKFTKKTDNVIYQIDLPRIIIEGAEIDTNATFLTDFIEAKIMPDFIIKNRLKLTALNAASVKKADFKNGFDVAFHGNDVIIKSDVSDIAIDRKKIDTNDILDITFNSDMVMIDYKRSSHESAFNVHKFDREYSRLHLIIGVSGQRINTYFGNKLRVGTYKVGQNIKFTKDEISLIAEANTTNIDPRFRLNNRSTIDEQPTIDADTGTETELTPIQVLVTSSEFETAQIIGSKIEIGNHIFTLNRGLNLLTGNLDGDFRIEHFDTYESEIAARNFLDRIESLIENKQFLAVAAHDAISTNYLNFKERSKDLGLNLLATLNGRVAYIAYSNEQKIIQENTSTTSLKQVITVPVLKRPKYDLTLTKDHWRKNKPSNIDYSKDTNRFIAHAGGELDGYKYTDSLDALNANYKRGFRLFELDIIETSDNYFVAAHDWKQWAEMTGYKGDLPPSRDIFMAHKIHNKYDPMDMQVINKWFSDHPDAILVTDKVNSPERFSKKFIDKSRLMMELFSWEAVKEGLSLEIKASIPTFDLLKEIKKNKVDYLKNLGVRHIAASRFSATTDTKLIKEIVESGIKIYAFHISFEKGKDEVYVACNESNYFYGMYADSWDFNSNLDCSNY